MRILLLSLLLSSHVVHARRFKYYLDPHRAEQILADIPLKPRLTDEKWLSVLGSRRGQRYEVQPGDTLWDISRQSFGNPGLWTKLWQVNSTLANPHEITVGQLLAYYRDEGDPQAPQIPLLKLIPNTQGAVADLDSDSLIHLDIKNQYRPPFYVIDDEEVLGELVGSYSRRKWLSLEDALYVRPEDKSALKPGQHYSVVRVETKVRDGTSLRLTSLGTLVRLVGEIEVIESGPELAKVMLTRQHGVVDRGDKVLALRSPVKDLPVFHPPLELEARIVMGELPESEFFSQGQIVLLNKGQSEGMKEGYLFRAQIKADPVTESERSVNPDYSGEIQLISVSKEASIGFILRNTHPLSIGDTVVAAQKFTDPPPPPRRPISEIEIR